jgi:hypothetical protein
MEQRKDPSKTETPLATKRAYSPPILTHLGTIAQLTAGNNGVTLNDQNHIGMIMR